MHQDFAFSILVVVHVKHYLVTNVCSHLEGATVKQQCVAQRVLPVKVEENGSLAESRAL